MKSSKNKKLNEAEVNLFKVIEECDKVTNSYVLNIGAIQCNVIDNHLYYYNNKLAKVYVEVDGYYYANLSGTYSDEILKIVSDSLFELNKPWREEIEKAFK